MAATAAVSPSAPLKIFRPEYIRFLLDRKTPLNFHVNVGDPAVEKVERIGALRWMLIARSKVLRVMLFESELKPGNEFDIHDLDPETFRHFLTFIYGYDNTGSLSFEDAVKLLVAAEKYDVSDLKKLLGTEITPRVTADNVCTVLQHGFVCETVPALWKKATDTVQSYTEAVFASEQFLSLKTEAVVHILQQDALSVQEVGVWRAALKWARHQLSPNSGLATPHDFRRTMVPLLQHTRLFTLTPDELCKEVIPSKVLSMDDLEKLCLALSLKGQPSDLTSVCQETQKRGQPRTLSINDSYNSSSSHMKLLVITKAAKVKITSLAFRSLSVPETCGPEILKNLKYNCKATVKFYKMNDLVFEPSDQSLGEIQFNQVLCYGQSCEMYINVDLEANNTYMMEACFDYQHPTISYKTTRYTVSSSNDIEIAAFIGVRPYRGPLLARYSSPTTFFNRWCYNAYDNDSAVLLA